MEWYAINWNELWSPTNAILEIVLRGSLVYLLLFAVLRIFRRESGALGITDLLFVVLVADAAQNAMSAEYRSLTEGAVLVATLVAWNFSLDWLSYRSRWFQHLVHPDPLPLIKNGRLIQHNLRSEMISREELSSQLREAGIERFSDVKSCHLEGDGKISVVKKSVGGRNAGKKKKRSGIAT